MNSKVFFCVGSLSLSLASLPVFAGSQYKLWYDRFENTKKAEYVLNNGTECRLNRTLQSNLFSCTFLTITRSIVMVVMISASREWDIMTYQWISPYSEKKAPAIITYKNGTKKNIQLPANFRGIVTSRGTVMESVGVRLEGLRQELLSIDNIELKYGTNEYYIKLDDALTRKALNYQE